MRIKAGARAPQFQAQDVQGAPVTLGPFTGKLLLLSFFRSASCPLCSLRAYYLTQRFPDLRAKGLAVITVFETSVETTMQYVGSQHPEFPVIADPETKLYQLYGIERSTGGLIRGMVRRLPDYVRAFRLRTGGKISDGDLRLLPADFLIGPDRRIRLAHYGQDTGDHLPFATIERMLDEA